MSHSRRVPEGASPFLSKEERGDHIKKWKQITNANENSLASATPYSYGAESREGHKNKFFDIANFHQESFINDVIPRMLSEKDKNKKITILDTGTGVGFFPDQIRKAFGDKVKVFSTGVKKRSAKEVRKRIYKNMVGLPKNEEDLPSEHFSLNLHPSDLKWRSIKELSGFEEFDLIIDTFGEAFYEFGDNRDFKKLEEYLRIAVKKLKDGGYISVAPIRISNEEKEKFLNPLEHELGIRFVVWGTSLKILKDKNVKKE